MPAIPRPAKLTAPQIELDVPTWPKELAEREHNRFSREALKDELALHHRKRLPWHFQATARSKYGYAPRSEAYKRRKMKRYGSRTDLVKTGATEQAFTKGQPKIVVSGAATSLRGFAGRLALGKFPFLVAYRVFKGLDRYVPRRFKPKSALLRAAASLVFKPKGGVNLEQMRKEITCFTKTESREVATGFLAGYWRRLTGLMAQRKRKRYRS